MRLVYVIPSIQHPLVRGPTRHYYFLRELSQRHDITLLTLQREKIPNQALEEVTAYTEALYSFPADIGLSIQASRRWLPSPQGSRLQRAWRVERGLRAMKRLFVPLLQRGDYDGVLFHGKTTFPLLRGVQIRALAMDFCDATSLRVKTTMEYARAGRLPWLLMRYVRFRWIEAQMQRKTPYLCFASNRDRAYVRGPADRSPVIPNGLDLDYWRRRTDQREEDSLLFAGVLDYEPNEDAALYLLDEIVPRLASEGVNCKLRLVGRDPTPAILQRAAHHRQVEVTGWVEDMRPYLEQATLCVAPIRFASGLQTKAQEALAMELPLVTTSVVAEGVRTDEGAPPLAVANTPAEFVSRIRELLANRAERRRLAQEGRHFAERHYHWQRSAGLLEELCLDAIEGARGRASYTRPG
jgi:polysaccharide biosynthesis protein PslH